MSFVDTPRQVTVRTGAEWAVAWRAHAGDRPAPVVDFSKEMVVAVFLGTRRTSGYGVEIGMLIDILESFGLNRIAQVDPANGGVTCANGWTELAGPDDPLPGVDAERLRLLLREIFTAAGGTHDDWPTYDRVMAEERRTAVLVTPERTRPS